MRIYFLAFVCCLATVLPAIAQKANVPGLNSMKKSNQYIEKKEYDKALLHINHALKKDSLNPFYYYTRSVIFFYLNDLDKAIADGQKAIAIDPKESGFYSGLAVLYQKRAHPSDSSLIVYYYNEALKLDHNDYTGYYNRGLFLLKQNKSKEALDDFYKARKLNPSTSEIHYQIGMTKAFNLHYYSDAVADFDKAIELNPNEAECYRARGLCFYELGDIARSTKDSEKAFALSPDDSGVLLLKASLYEVTDKVPEALKLLDYIISKDTLEWQAYNNRGIIKLFWIKEYESGILDLQKALLLKPDALMIHNNIGLGYSTLEKYSEAIKEFDLAIKEMPESSYAYNNRGYAKFKMNDKDGAFADIFQSIKLDPSNSYAFRNRALIYIELKKTEDACLDLKRAQELKFEVFYGTEVKELIDKYCSK
ncbi:MAG: repeat-containing protein [Chitinophagaceae bacterium]|nr:repeat-containing protein [Chitinophagaceae bacterium]